MSLQPGEIIDGKYRIVRLVGEGGMGAVYQGENTRIKRTVAIKVLHAAVAEKEDVVQRFEREAQAAGRIGSEHIVEVLDLGNLPSGERYMVMEFLDGQDLTIRIKSKKRLSPLEIVPIAVQVLEGLAAAHDAGIIHRDLKPDNIFILGSKAGRKDFVKLLDFGVSKFSALDAEMSMTRTGAVMGTPYYMSPEQAKGNKIDQRSDIYSMGVVLYQAVTGRVPFNAGSFNELLFKIALETPEPLPKLVPGMPAAFVHIIERAMHREPSQRFTSAHEFRSALLTFEAQMNSTNISATAALPEMPDMRALAPSSPALGAPPPRAMMPTPVPGGLDTGSAGPGYTVAGIDSRDINHPALGSGSYPGGTSPSNMGAATPPGGMHLSQTGMAVARGSGSSRGGLLAAAVAGGVVLLGAVVVGAVLFAGGSDESDPVVAVEPPADLTAEPDELPAVEVDTPELEKKPVEEPDEEQSDGSDSSDKVQDKPPEKPEPAPAAPPPPRPRRPPPPPVVQPPPPPPPPAPTGRSWKDQL
jgi:serine/threonine-protein kinase